ncbi:MAG: MFS transporter [Polyangiaceae bacterium]
MNPPPQASFASVPFPRVFRVAILLEVLERLAFYGVYINLTVYVTETVHLTDAENGLLMAIFAGTRAWLPVATGPLSDRIGFRKSLLWSFALYIAAYASLFAFPSRLGAWCAVLGMAFAGAFLKPVIPATVRRYSPEGRHATGFSIFYASVNAGSVVGKTGAKWVRTALSLRASMLNSVVASAIALIIAFTMFFEPKTSKEEEPAEGTKGEGPFRSAPSIPTPPPPTFLQSLALAGRDPKFVAFLVLVSGYYLLIEQFYQTFPVYILRQLGDKAPREYITLINPLAIATLQLLFTRITRKLPPVFAMTLGIFIGACSMLLMGLFPSLFGACMSFFVFAVAEMVFSPRYYEYVSSFAPKGREGLYAGLGFVPVGLGGIAGGFLSGGLIGKYLPKGGPLHPLPVWGTYALIGVACAFSIGVFGLVTRKRTPR